MRRLHRRQGHRYDNPGSGIEIAEPSPFKRRRRMRKTEHTSPPPRIAHGEFELLLRIAVKRNAAQGCTSLIYRLHKVINHLGP